MAKYKITIEDALYTPVFKVELDLEPDTIDILTQTILAVLESAYSTTPIERKN